MGVSKNQQSINNKSDKFGIRTMGNLPTALPHTYLPPNKY